MKKDKKDLGNNYFKSGWQPSAEFDESTGLGEITHIGQDPNYKSKFDTILKYFQYTSHRFFQNSWGKFLLHNRDFVT